MILDMIKMLPASEVSPRWHRRNAIYLPSIVIKMGVLHFQLPNGCQRYHNWQSLDPLASGNRH
jgi:hypothetical protein